MLKTRTLETKDGSNTWFVLRAKKAEARLGKGGKWREGKRKEEMESVSNASRNLDTSLMFESGSKAPVGLVDCHLPR